MLNGKTLYKQMTFVTSFKWLGKFTIVLLIITFSRCMNFIKCYLRQKMLSFFDSGTPMFLTGYHETNKNPNLHLQSHHNQNFHRTVYTCSCMVILGYKTRPHIYAYDIYRERFYEVELQLVQK